MSNLKFKILGKENKSRTGEISINNKIIKTPGFMPVATRGAIKSTPHTFLENTDVLLANTYHLYLRPGVDLINELGGIHKFMNWKVQKEIQRRTNEIFITNAIGV